MVRDVSGNMKKRRKKQRTKIERRKKGQNDKRKKLEKKKKMQEPLSRAGTKQVGQLGRTKNSSLINHFP